MNAGVGLVAAQPAPGQSLRCPALYAIGVPGTGESSPDANPSDDHGMLSSIFLPMLAAEPDRTDRAYVPYEAGFGGAVPGGPVPYSQSVTGGLTELRSMAQSVADRCQNTRLAFVGYSQGAHVASLFAQEIGRGQSTIPADRIAGVALLADPTRYPGASLFPGAAGKLAPDPAPGTIASGLSALQAQPAPAPGGGIGPLRDLAPDFGALTGRVASFCIDGDLACDSPANAPILHMITNIAGQALLPLDDPLTALSSISDALAATVAKTTTDVVDKDLHGLAPGSLVLSRDKSLSERLAEASDPRSVIDDPTAQSAALRLATITLNTLTSIVGVVLSPEDVCQIGTIGARDPLAGLAALAAKMFAAMPKRSAAPRFTQVVTQAFNAIGRLVSDNLELVDTQVWSKYQDAVARHGAYALTTVAAGRPSVQFVADWFIALARALPAPTQPKPVVAQPDSVLASMPDQNAQAPAADDPAEPPPPHRNSPKPKGPTTGAGTAVRVDKTDPTHGRIRPESAKAQAKRLEASRHVVWALLLSESACLLYTGRRRIVRTGWDTDFLG
ncbi:cutinase family protein [Nocardia sp. NPDC050175]|uniref:cutinase family protein n=1 Tax=Nocardia sp. NPDC050175 TaxID=3364317 RepID=UPI0037985E62